MADAIIDPTRAPVAYGRWAVPQLFRKLQQPGAEGRLRALASLCDLVHEPERLYQTVNGGFLNQLKVLFGDEDPAVRAKTCELLHLLTSHSIGRQALLASSLLPLLSQLLDDSSFSCRRNVHRVLNRLALLPAGAEVLLSLVPKLMLKLTKEEDEEVQMLLLSTLTYCSRLDALPGLASDGISLLGCKLSHKSPNIRREAAAAMMALSIPVEGKRQVCEDAEVLSVLIGLLQDKDVEVQANAAGVIMNTVIITRGKQRCLDLDVLPVLLSLLSEKQQDDEAKEEMRKRRKALIMYILRALTALAEAPSGRQLLLEQLPLLEKKSEAAEEDQDIRRAAQTAIRVITWTT
ncbi:radial spoke head 14 homolog [Archocentrus centrarchus]|uniref:radial spoke head 14 homolog n=1 Tax=Archocentrus centrarchus TaxID=63155 RepID=UPI0011E9F850|nr:radial spoke head 14 homolog [Archocentrus centrarchus]